MSYHHYLPQESCYRDIIHSIWQIDQAPVLRQECILPKGIVEVIFNFSEGPPILAKAGDYSGRLPQCFISGFSQAPISVQLPEHQVFFGVLLQPLAVQKIFGHPAGMFANTTVDCSLLNPAFLSLWQQLAEQDDFDKRVQVFLAWIKRKYTAPLPQQQLINHFLYANSQHGLSVTALAGSMCYSPRQLSRKMIEATGMNTETILLYKKYLHALQLVHQTDLPLTAIAYDSQYADQSHFIRSFKSFAHITPGEYRRNKSAVQAHLYKDVR